MNGLSSSKAKLNANVSHIKGAALDIMDDGKKLANDLYDGGVKKVDAAQKKAEDLTDELIENIRENPVKSVLIAGGIGFLMSILLR